MSCQVYYLFLLYWSLRWVTVVWKGSEETFGSYDQFITMFRRVFAYAPKGKEVSKWILTLWQENRWAAANALDFRTLAAKSGWNEPALKVVSSGPKH